MRHVYINLPVENLQRSIEFFTELGFSFNPQFSDDTAACMILSSESFAMLLTREKFRRFSPNAICDTASATEALVCLSCESRGKVEDLVARAVSAGGSTFREPQDFGFMYGHAFLDPDGHVWELMYMDLAGLSV